MPDAKFGFARFMRSKLPDSKSGNKTSAGGKTGAEAVVKAMLSGNKSKSSKKGKNAKQLDIWSLASQRQKGGEEAPPTKDAQGR